MSPVNRQYNKFEWVLRDPAVPVRSASRFPLRLQLRPPSPIAISASIARRWEIKNYTRGSAAGQRSPASHVVKGSESATAASHAGRARDSSMTAVTRQWQVK